MNSSHVALAYFHNTSQVAFALLAVSLLSHVMDRLGRLLPVAIGAACAAVAALSMTDPIHVPGGLLFDGRNAVLVVCAGWGGPLAALVAGALVCAFRWHLGGAGLWPGLVSILA